MNRPMTAGDAPLSYILPNGALPVVNGREIHLAGDTNAEQMVQILGGTNCVVRVPGRRSTHTDVMFGTDSTGGHFASPLAQSVGDLDLLRTPTGEQLFLAGLRPKAMVQYAEEFGQDLVRQGDMFYATLAQNDPRLSQRLTYVGRKGFSDSYETHEVEEHSLFGTRHLLTGQLYRPAEGSLFGIKLRGKTVVIFTGQVAAPDHDAYVATTPTLAMPTRAFQRTRVHVAGQRSWDPWGD